MCETNGYAANDAEQSQETLEDELFSEESNQLVKFDIGEFVHNHRKVQLLFVPWIRLYNTVFNIIRWTSPYVTLFWMILSCLMAIFSPVFFIIIPITYILIVMALSGIKKKGKPKKKVLQITIKKKAENNDLNVKATVEKQVQNDIKEFISLLIQMEEVTELITKGLENINRIIKWEDFKMSLRIFLSILLAIVILLLVPLSIILIIAILSVFCLNVGFKPVAIQAFNATKVAMKSLMTLVGLNELFPSSNTNRQISTNSVDEEEWYDAEMEGRPEQSSDDDDDDYGSDNEGYEDSSLNQKKLQDSSSILTQLADYRRKQKKLNSGKCRMCDVPFSSILKKRQYCRHCGESFCSKCCSHRVKRSVFGATAPAAYEETVLVCKPCFDLLMNVNGIDQPITTTW